MNDHIVWAADIGSITRNRFGWCRAVSGGHEDERDGSSIEDFACGVARDLDNSKPVALGFECPLFVPVREEPIKLLCARCGEGNRPFSANAGCTSLTAGLVEYTWIFEKVRCLVKKSLIRPTFDWKRFCSKEANLLIWEAFVTRQGQRDNDNTDIEDARVAVRAFLEACDAGEPTSTVTAENPFSLVGASLLRAGLSDDPSLLCQQCIVIEAQRSVS